MMVITVIYVAMRYLAYTFHGALEVSQLCLVVLAFLSLAYTQAQGRNVRIEFVLERIPLKIRFWVELLALAIGLAVWAAILWKSSEEAWFALVTNQFALGVIRFPTWPSKCMVPLGSFILCLEIIAEGAKLIVHKRQGSLKVYLRHHQKVQ